MNRFQKAVSVMKANSIDSVFLRNATRESGSEVTERPYTKSEIVYVCITKTARTISQVPIVIEQRKVDRKGQETWEAVYNDNSWQRLIDRPNMLMDRATFVESMVSRWMLDGDVWGLPSPPEATVPVTLLPVGRANVEADVDESTGQLLGWIYKPNGNKGPKIPYRFDEVVHIRFWNDQDYIYGLSPLEAGRLPLVSDYKAAKYNEKFFDEGAVLSGVLTSKNRLQDDSFKRIQMQFNQRHKGWRNAWGTLVLDNDTKYEPVGVTQRDMQFLDLRRYGRDALYQVFGMMKSIVSVTDDLNYATATEQTKIWWKSTLVPLIGMIQSAFNFTFFSNYFALQSRNRQNLRLRFALEEVEALREDLGQKAEIAKKFFDMGVSFNEINQKLKLGFDDHDDRAVGFLPMSLRPINEIINPIPPEPKSFTLASVINPPALPPAPPEQVAAIEEPEEQKAIPDSFQDEAYIARCEYSWKAFTRNTSRIEQLFEGKVRRLFFEMRKRSMMQLISGRSDSPDGAVLKGPAAVEREEFNDLSKWIQGATSGFYSEAVTLGVTTVAAEIGIAPSFDVYDPAAIEYLKERTVDIVGIVDTVKHQLRDKLGKLVKEGATIDDMAEEVKHVYNMASYRAKTIARTEVVGAANFGRNEQMQQTGFTKKRWFTASDEKVRHDHAAMHGKVTDMHGNWTLPDGSVLAHPGAMGGAASQVINCRCIEVVVPESYDEDYGSSLSPAGGGKHDWKEPEFVDSEFAEEFRSEFTKLGEKYSKIPMRKFKSKEAIYNHIKSYEKELRDLMEGYGDLSSYVSDEDYDPDYGTAGGFDYSMFARKSSGELGRKLKKGSQATKPKFVKEMASYTDMFEEWTSPEVAAKLERYRVSVTDLTSSTRVRSGYNPISREIKMGALMLDVYMHEYAHYVEHTLNLGEVNVAWRDMKAIESQGKLVKVSLGEGYREDEYTLKDKFINEYVGKVYEKMDYLALKDARTEVLSTGAQNLDMDYVEGFIVDHFDHFALTVGELQGHLVW